MAVGHQLFSKVPLIGTAYLPTKRVSVRMRIYSMEERLNSLSSSTKINFLLFPHPRHHQYVVAYQTPATRGEFCI